jgi:hypothetical protein
VLFQRVVRFLLLTGLLAASLQTLPPQETDARIKIMLEFIECERAKEPGRRLPDHHDE